MIVIVIIISMIIIEIGFSCIQMILKLQINSLDNIHNHLQLTYKGFRQFSTRTLKPAEENCLKPSLNEAAGYLISLMGIVQGVESNPNPSQRFFFRNAMSPQRRGP